MWVYNTFAHTTALLRAIKVKEQLHNSMTTNQHSTTRTVQHRPAMPVLLCLSVIAMWMHAGNVFAAAGDVISTRSTITYDYQGTTLVQESSPTGNTTIGAGNGSDTVFTEDALVNFSITTLDGSAVPVTGGQSGVATAFSLTNNGNAVQDFLLAGFNTTVNPFTGLADNLDVLLPLPVYVENGNTPGYQLAEDTAVFVDELAPGSSAIVYVVADLPAGNAGDVAAVTLVAQVAQGGTAGEGAAITNDNNGNTSPAGTYSNGATSVAAGNPVNMADSTALETVFNDPAGLDVEDVDSTGAAQDATANGQHADSSAYQIQGSPLSINKTVTVIDTLGGNDPHPGATLRYRLDVSIIGSVNINNLVISDTIPLNTTYTPGSIVLNGVAQTDAPFTVDGVDYAEFNGADVIVDLSQAGAVSIAPGVTNTIIFDVTID